MPQFPEAHARVFQTPGGVRYLKEPGVVLLAQPHVQIQGMDEFLRGFPEEEGFRDYPFRMWTPDRISPGAALSKVAGQGCYASFGPTGTPNTEADRYLGNILAQKHGSVLEHAQFSFLVYGVSRSFSHELVRHRVGIGFSQLSQRYVGPRILRFVERPEFQGDDYLHEEFEQEIEADHARYCRWIKVLEERLGAEIEGLSKTDRRKRVQQTARTWLPNAAETFLTLSANLRTWRHVLEVRGSVHAETEMRLWSYKVLQILQDVVPEVFRDVAVEVPDGYPTLRFQHSKV